MKFKPVLLASLGLLLALWPFIHDQEALSCDLSPQACTNGGSLAFVIIMFSISVGCLLVSIALFTKMHSSALKAFLIFVVWVGLGLVDFIANVAIGFSRHFVF